MRALIPVLSGLATVAGTFLAAYLNRRRAGNTPESRSRTVTRMVVTIILTLALAVATVIMAIALAD